MIEIKEITVTASCSKNYQKAEFTMTAMVENEQDIADVKAICTQHALQLLETLPINEEPKQPVKQYQPNKMNQPVQNQGYAPRQAYQSNQPKSEILNIGGYNYRKCVNKQGNVFYALVNDADSQYAKKYLQVDEVSSYFNGGNNNYGC